MCDSDAVITKGVVKVLCDIYGGWVPWQVTNNTRDVTEELNFGNILSVNRRNGAYNMIKKIKEYAEQCKTS
jgi:sulfur transfer protein SufE